MNFIEKNVSNRSKIIIKNLWVDVNWAVKQEVLPRPRSIFVTAPYRSCHCETNFCHREPAKQSRLSPFLVIARNVAISPFAFSCHCEPAKQSRLSSFHVIARNEAVLSRPPSFLSLRACEAISLVILSCHCEERGDPACRLFLSLRRTWRIRSSPFLVIARNEAISPFNRRQTEKRDRFAGSQ